MRQFILAGFVILGLGAFLLLRGASFTSRSGALHVGQVEVTADQQQSIPPWAGAVAMLAGGALMLAGTGKRT